jgi:hypothetical protein
MRGVGFACIYLKVGTEMDFDEFADIVVKTSLDLDRDYRSNVPPGKEREAEAQARAVDFMGRVILRRIGLDDADMRFLFAAERRRRADH